jgi:hypothetical protein
LANLPLTLDRYYQSADVKTAQRLLVDLAKRLETEHPSAAESVREGLDETLTVLHAESVAAAAPILGHQQRGGESTQSHASREAQRQAMAQWADDAAVGGRGRPRSREGLPAREGIG